MDSLSEKREELKRQLEAGKYATLFDVMMRSVNRFIQKLVRYPQPLPFWSSALALTLVILVIGLLLLILFNELNTTQIVLLLEGTGLLYVSLILFKIHERIFNAHFHDHIVDAIKSNDDLADLQHWLSYVSNKKATVFFALIIGATSIINVVLSGLYVGLLGLGLSIWTVILVTLLGVEFFYVVNLFFSLPIHLSRYRFELYDADLASSELIHYLSRMFMNSLSLFALWSAFFTLGIASMESLIPFNIFRLLGWWGLITALFAIVQYSLSRIITTAKYKALGDLQAKISQLQAEAKLGDKETRDTLNWLMDYHDRIKATRNSALDLRAILSFVNSLLLPLIAFVLANLETIKALFP